MIKKETQIFVSLSSAKSTLHISKNIRMKKTQNRKLSRYSTITRILAVLSENGTPSVGISPPKNRLFPLQRGSRERGTNSALAHAR